MMFVLFGMWILASILQFCLSQYSFETMRLGRCWGAFLKRVRIAEQESKESVEVKQQHENVSMGRALGNQEDESAVVRTNQTTGIWKSLM